MNLKITQQQPFGVLVEPQGAPADVRELDVEKLRSLFREHQLVVLRGFKTFQDSDEFAQYCEAWGEVSLWPFGKVLELIQRENPEDHIFDHNYVPLHWDGMYRQQVPEYQIFHCVQAPLKGQGGRTTFSHTANVVKNASTALRTQWSKVTGVYHRKMEFYHSRITSPIIVRHPFRNLEVIRYNEPPSDEHGEFINPPELEFSGLNENKFEEFHMNLKMALYNPEHFYAHEWQVGDVVIADNFTLLHGREKFESKAPRHIQRVHVLSASPCYNSGLESYQ